MNVWVCLDLYKCEDVEVARVLNDFSTYFDILKWKVDSEKIMTLEVDIESLEDLLYLPFILGDDIVIYGMDSDIVMTKADMKELGLT